MDRESEHARDAGPPEGRYANYFEVGHNDIEFVLNFGQFFSEHQKLLHTRIITSPVYAKALLEILRQSLDRYEETFGAIAKEDESETQHRR